MVFSSLIAPSSGWLSSLLVEVVLAILDGFGMLQNDFGIPGGEGLCVCEGELREGEVFTAARRLFDTLSFCARCFCVRK